MAAICSRKVLRNTKLTDDSAENSLNLPEIVQNSG